MRSKSLVGVLLGILSAGVALGVGELVAVAFRPAAAPLIAVANRAVFLTPSSTQRSAIDTFGTNDKSVLLVSIVILLAALGAFAGYLALARLWYGLVVIGAVGALGVYCALTANASRTSDVVPTLIGTAAALGTMTLLAHLANRPAATPVGRSAAALRRAAAADGTARRNFLVGGGTVAAVAAVSGFGGRAALHHRFDVSAKRAEVALPEPKTSAGSVPRGADLGRSGLPWRTTSTDFYRIDTAIDVPQVSQDDWSLRIHGMVDHEITLTYKQLLARPMIERWVTLCCVSNEVGGNLIGNAYWQGVRLADVLREVGVQDSSDQLLMTSVDGMTIGAPTKVVMDGRDAMIAIGMNGSPLPIEHGFPARIVVPGLYGYVSACKWVADIEATTFNSRVAYWVGGGWAQQPAIKLESRIDTPHSGAQVAVGRPVAVAGVAWDQHVGVSKVEVQVNDGSWQQARLASVPSTDTWRQWVLPWTPPSAGSYRLKVRAVDEHGTPQTTNEQPPFPSGATGLHSVVVRAG